MADPANGSAEGLRLMRLGWMMAETHGRYRLGDDPRLRPMARTESHRHVLPLNIERSPAEQRIEAERVLTAVAAEQQCDLLAGKDLGFDATDLPNSMECKASDYMRSLAVQLRDARKENRGSETLRLLDEMDRLFYLWDCAIQDNLATGPYGRSSAYQLGRGIAETYWALNPEADASRDDSWAHLLVERFNALAALLRRSAALLPELAAEALTATLEQWRGVAEDVTRQEESSRSLLPRMPRSTVDRGEATTVLGQQAGVWRDLLLSGSDPTRLVATDQTWLRARRLGPLFKSFLPEIVGLLLGLLLIGGAVLLVVLGEPLIPKALGATLAAVLGAFGVTSSSFFARTKAGGLELLERLRRKVKGDALIAAATYLPQTYSRRDKSVRQSASAGSGRHLGPDMKYNSASTMLETATGGGVRSPMASGGRRRVRGED